HALHTRPDVAGKVLHRHVFRGVLALPVVGQAEVGYAAAASVAEGPVNPRALLADGQRLVDLEGNAEGALARELAFRGPVALPRFRVDEPPVLLTRCFGHPRLLPELGEALHVVRNRTGDGALVP